MSRNRIDFDSPANHNALMARLCSQAAAGFATRLSLTADPAKRAILLARMKEREAESRLHSERAGELAKEEAKLRRPSARW